MMTLLEVVLHTNSPPQSAQLNTLDWSGVVLTKKNGNLSSLKNINLPEKFVLIKVFSGESECHVLSGHIDVDVEADRSVL